MKIDAYFINFRYICVRLILGAINYFFMTKKYAVKNAFAEKYLAEANDSDKMFHKDRAYAFHVCGEINHVALFDSKEEAEMAYANSHSNPGNETGIIVEMLILD